MQILKNATLIHLHPAEIVPGQDVVIENNMITQVGSHLAAKYPDAEILDLDGKYLSPGIVCSHNHFYSALARGILADIPPSPDFVSILRNLWWRLDRALDEESLYYSGLIGALEAIKAGTTSVIDHHASPEFIKGSLNTLQKGFEKTGLRGILAYEITDRNGERGAREGIEESVEFIHSLRSMPGANQTSRLVEGAIGGHAPFTLSDDTLKQVAEAVRETGRGIHFHVSEDRYDSAYSHHHYGKDPLERLQDFGLLGSKSILVHGVYLSEKEIDILNQNDAFLVHNPRSNMNNGVGYLKELYRVKNSALGTDGIGSNMFEELKFAFFKNNDGGGHLDMSDILRMLQSGNVVLERYFKQKFGKIENGFAADMVIYDYQSPTPLTADNLAGHLAFGFSSRDVESVIINGQMVYKERRFSYDTTEIYREARDQAKRLWNKMNTIP